MTVLYGRKRKWQESTRFCLQTIENKPNSCKNNYSSITNIQFLISGKESSLVFSKEPKSFNFISSFIEYFIVLYFLFPTLSSGYYWYNISLLEELSCFIRIISSICQKMRNLFPLICLWIRKKTINHSISDRSIWCISWSKNKAKQIFDSWNYGVYFGGESTFRSSEGLRALFLAAHAEQGWARMLVESIKRIRISITLCFWSSVRIFHHVPSSLHR